MTRCRTKRKLNRDDSKSRKIKKQKTDSATLADPDWSTEGSPITRRLCEYKNGLTITLPEDRSPWTFFQLCFPSSIFDNWSQQTNLYAAQKQCTHKDPEWINTSPEEMKAFLGVHIWMSIIQLPEISMYWNQRTRQNIIAKVFTRERFQQLLSYWHLNDNSTAVS